MAGFFSGLEGGELVRDLHAPDFPHGTNMAVRREVVQSLGGFREDLGRVGTSLLSYEEYDMFDRLARTGSVIRYQPKAWVDHHVDPARVSLKWLIRRAWVNGRSHVVWEGERSRSRHLLTLVKAMALVIAQVGRGLLRLPRAGPGSGCSLPIWPRQSIGWG